LTFGDSLELSQFLFKRGILHNEVDVDEWHSKLSNEVIVVDTKKIYDVEESALKYLLNYKYYSINDVAEMLSFSRPTVYKLVNDQTLKAIRIHGQPRNREINEKIFGCVDIQFNITTNPAFKQPEIQSEVTSISSFPL